MLTTKKWVALLPAFCIAILGVVLLGGCTPPGPRALLQGERLIREGRYNEAIEKLRRATQLLPQNAQAWNYLGLACHHARQFDLAARAYEQALACDRNLAAARFNLGCLYLEQNNLAAAVPELTTYTLLQPQAIDGWLQLGLAHLRARRLTDAENSFNHVRLLDPRHPEALNDLGVIQLQRNRPREAYAFFNAALQAQPHYGPALLNVAIVSDRYFKNHAFALEKYRAYLAAAPSAANRAEVDQIVRQLTLELYPPRSTPSNAVARVARSTDLAPLPTNPPSHVAPADAPPPTNRAVASIPVPAPAAPTNVARAEPPKEPAPLPKSLPKETEAPKPAPAIPVEEVRLPSEPPIKPPAEVQSGPQPSEVQTSAPPAAASDAFTPPSRVMPVPEKKGFFARLNPRTWFERKSKPDAAASAPASPTVGTPRSVTAPAAPAPSEPPATPPAPARYIYGSPARPAAGDRAAAQPYVLAGLQAQRGGHWAVAVEAYRKAIALDPAWFEAQYNLGLAAYDGGDLPLSLMAYETALAIRPESPDARYNFALALQQAHYPQDAANELERVLVERRDDVRAHLTLGNLYAQALAQPRLARRHYLKVLALEPDHPQATAIRYWLAANPP